MGGAGDYGTSSNLKQKNQIHYRSETLFCPVLDINIFIDK